LVEKAGCCFADCLLAGRIQALFNLLCVRLPAVKYKQSVASAVLFKLAEAVLQVALSRLAEAVSRQPAVNYQPSVVRLLYFHIGRVRTIVLLALFLLAVAVSRLLDVNYEPPVVFARLFTLAVA
jgi:hypothetical protein